MTYPYTKKFIVTLKGDDPEMLAITPRFASYNWHIPKTCEAMEIDTLDKCEELHQLRVQLNVCESFFDMLWRDSDLSKLFRTDLVKVRCSLCNIQDCSTRNDRNECLRMELLTSKSKPTEKGKE